LTFLFCLICLVSCHSFFHFFCWYVVPRSRNEPFSMGLTSFDADYSSLPLSGRLTPRKRFSLRLFAMLTSSLYPRFNFVPTAPFFYSFFFFNLGFAFFFFSPPTQLSQLITAVLSLCFSLSPPPPPSSLCRVPGLCPYLSFTTRYASLFFLVNRAL